MNGNLDFGYTVTVGDLIHGRVVWVSWVAYRATLTSKWSAM